MFEKDGRSQAKAVCPFETPNQEHSTTSDLTSHSHGQKKEVHEYFMGDCHDQHDTIDETVH